MERITTIQPVREDLERLLKRSFRAGERIDREGRIVGVTVRPQSRAGQEGLDLLVSIYPLRISPARDGEREADAEARKVFLAALRGDKEPLRLAACDALGQLGDPDARTALAEAAKGDTSPYVRAAAGRALAALDTPRIHLSDLAGQRLLLQCRWPGAWLPHDIAPVDALGRTWFSSVPADAEVRLDLVGGPGPVSGGELPAGTWDRRKQARQEAGESVFTEAKNAPYALNAAGVEVDGPALPKPLRINPEAGKLTCTVYLSEEKELRVAFLWNAPTLERGWVRVIATGKRTGDVALNAFVPLNRDRTGALTGELNLGEKLDPAEAYALEFEPVPGPKREA